MDHKFRIFLWLFTVGGLLGEVFLLYLAVEDGKNWPLPVFLTAWLLVGTLLQRFLFRCPHCGKYALCPPGLISLHFPGGRCKYCGQDY